MRDRRTKANFAAPHPKKPALIRFAPLAIGLGLALSYGADAGQEIPAGASRAMITGRRAALPPRVIAPALHVFSSDFGPTQGRGLLHEARLELGAPELLTALPDEVEPRAILKNGAAAFPAIDRRHKGDPLVGLRPAIQGQLREAGAREKIRAGLLIFGRDKSGLAARFSADEAGPTPLESIAHFEPWSAAETPVAVSGATPAASGGATPSSSTMRPAALAARLAEGATPAIPRAAALSSTTPFSADQTPVQARFALFGKNGRPVPQTESGRDYLALVPTDKREAEKYCLTQAIYFEARSEPPDGQAAVAQVVLNRMSSGLYPNSICGVVFQNRERDRACQFSFACEGKELSVREPEAFALAARIADNVLAGKTWVADVGEATHYHATYVRPRWARTLKRTDAIGKHIFYRLKSG